MEINGVLSFTEVKHRGQEVLAMTAECHITLRYLELTV